MQLTRETIFESAFDEGLFNDLPFLLTKQFKARSAIFHHVSKDEGYKIAASSGFWPKEQLEAYSRDFVDKDILWKTRALPKHVNKCWNVVDGLISRKEFERSDIFQNHYRKFGDNIAHAIGGIFDTPRGQFAIGLHRGKNSPGFEGKEVALLNHLAPEILKSISIRSNVLEAQERAKMFENVLANEDYPLLQISSDLKIRYQLGNAVEKLLMPHGVSTDRRELVAQSANGRLFLNRLRGAFENDCVIPVVISGSSECSPLIEARVFYSAAGKMLLVSSPLRSAKSYDFAARRLNAEYKLSNSEAKVAVAIGEGRSLNEIANLRGVSVNTIKSQLKNIYLKTNCDKQSKLATLVQSLR